MIVIGNLGENQTNVNWSEKGYTVKVGLELGFVWTGGVNLHIDTLGFLVGHWSLFHNCLLVFSLPGLWNSWGQWFHLFYLPHRKAFGAWHTVGIQLYLWSSSVSEWINENILIKGKKQWWTSALWECGQQQTFHGSIFWSK